MRKTLLTPVVLGLLAGCGQAPTRSFFPQTLDQELVVCDAGVTLQGADVSSYQGTIDWSQVAGAGLSFSIAKATEGLTLVDADFQANWAGMKAAGIVRGAYHFLHPDDGDGAGQADFFLSTVGTFAPGDLPPFLDWETSCNDADTTCVSTADAIAVAQDFIDEIRAKTGLPTVIYTYPYYWTSPADAGMGSPAQFGVDAVWFANYDTACPDLASPWTQWLFWQYTASGSVPGMNCGSPGACDLDEFNGDLAQLQQIAVGGDGGLPIPTPDGGTALPATVLDQASGNDAVALVNWTDGHLGVFAKTPTGDEEYSATTGAGDSWSPPTSLDTGADCGSAAAFWGASYLYPELFSPLSAGGTGHLWNTAGTWNSYQSLGGKDLAHLSTVVWPSGLVEVFAVGTLDGQAWHDYFDVSTQSWTGWASLGAGGGGALFSQGPRPLIWADGHGELYEVDSAGNVWRSSSASGDGTDWTAFSQIGSGIASRLSPVRWPDGSIELFGRGTDGNVWRTVTGPAGQGGFPAFTLLATQPTSGEPSAFMNPGGGAEVVAADASGNLLDIAYSVAAGSWPASFASLGETAGSPFGWIRGDGNAEVFAVDGAGNLVHSLRSSGSWSTWGAIGSGIDSCALAITVVDGGMGSSGGSSSSGSTGLGGSSGSSTSATSMASGSSGSSGSSSRGATTNGGSTSSGASPDGGAPPSGSSGCGCTASGTAAPLLWLVAAVPLSRRRKPRIQTRL